MKILSVIFVASALLCGLGCNNQSNFKSKFITKIDSIKSEEGIVNFIKEKFPEVECKNISLNAELPDFAAKIQTPRWSVNDVDGNGYNDLIVNLNINKAFYSFIILADTGKYHMVPLSSICEYGNTISRFVMINNQPAIILSGYALGNTLKTDTLVCKYDSFIEYNPHSNNYNIRKAEMNLGASGVESDEFPNINAIINFKKDSASCHKWFFNPAHKDFIYSLGKQEINRLLNILQYTDINKLKEKKFNNGKTDQPISKIKIYTDKQLIEISDYGLEGSYTLKAIYKIVYKY
jgi:hypothetical protein